MKVLVTGASGFVGSALCDELAKRVINAKVLMRKSRGYLAQSHFIPVTGDLRDPESLQDAVREVDVIFHVAGVVSAKKREDFFSSNAIGTRNLVEATQKYNPNLKRFVYISSLAAAGPSSPDRPRVEDDECKPISVYGMSKWAGEKEALAGRKTFPVVVVRPPVVYGPRDSGVYTFFQAISRGILPLLGWENPDPKRYSFVHVDDLVQGILLAGFESNVENGDIFYISGEGEYSWENAMRLIADAMEKKVFVLRLPLFAMKSAAHLCSLVSQVTSKPLPLSPDKIKELEAPAWTCSNSKAKKKLGFQPYWDLSRGFGDTARWYQNNGWL